MLYRVMLGCLVCANCSTKEHAKLIQKEYEAEGVVGTTIKEVR